MIFPGFPGILSFFQVFPGRLTSNPAFHIYKNTYGMAPYQRVWSRESRHTLKTIQCNTVLASICMFHSITILHCHCSAYKNQEYFWFLKIVPNISCKVEEKLILNILLILIVKNKVMTILHNYHFHICCLMVLKFIMLCQ